MSNVLIRDESNGEINSQRDFDNWLNAVVNRQIDVNLNCMFYLGDKPIDEFHKKLLLAHPLHGFMLGVVSDKRFVSLMMHRTIDDACNDPLHSGDGSSEKKNTGGAAGGGRPTGRVLKLV